LEIFFPKPCEGYLRINDARLYDKLDGLDESSNGGESSAEKPKEYDYYDNLGNDESETEGFENMHPKSMSLNGSACHALKIFE